MSNFITKLITLNLSIFALAIVSNAQSLPIVKPESVQMSSEKLNQIDGLVEKAIAKKKMPGAVVLVGRKGKIVFRKAYGKSSVVPIDKDMTVDTVFDLASLTKPVATATSIMMLVEKGKIRLDDKLGKFIPEIEDENAKQVTIKQLLTHTSGYSPSFDLRKKWDDRKGMLEVIKKKRLQHTTGSTFVYSDINFVLLGEIVGKLSETNLDTFTEKWFTKLEMSDSDFREFQVLSIGYQGIYNHDYNEKQNKNIVRVAKTQNLIGRSQLDYGSKEKIPRKNVLYGIVHDPIAFRLGGVSGNAGLFSTVDDLARYSQMLLNGGVLEGKRILSEATVVKMTKPYVVSEKGETRGLGWDINTKFSSNRGELFPLGSFGHTGWTGTGIWIDPLSETFIIFLSNRVHPDGKGSIVDVRAKVSTVVASSIKDISPQQIRDFEADYHSQVKLETEQLKFNIAKGNIKNVLPTSLPRKSILQLLKENSQMLVLNGIDVLQNEKFKQLDGLRIGLVTNHTGRNLNGKSTIDILNESGNLKLVSLFSPEHGIRGKLDQAKINDSIDKKTGLKIFSLYGKSRRPKPKQLKSLDALVFDIQDIGTRFYTYISTLRFVLEEAKAANKKVFVLDRPNPINGIDVAGAIADEDKLSFVATHNLPIRHGMTIGEIARMLNIERNIYADLEIIKMQNWKRSMWFDQTNQTWVNPSPNMRNLTQATLYPGIGLLETTNLSVGRGTDTPFEVIGSPWLDARKLVLFLKGKRLKGVSFLPITFTPKSSVFKGEKCKGINIIVTDRKAFEPIRTGIEIALALRWLHPYEWEIKNYNRLLVNQETFDLIRNKKSYWNVKAKWDLQLIKFKKRRAKYLLY